MRSELYRVGIQPDTFVPGVAVVLGAQFGTDNAEAGDSISVSCKVCFLCLLFLAAVSQFFSPFFNALFLYFVFGMCAMRQGLNAQNT